MDPFLNGVELYQQIDEHADFTSKKSSHQSFLPGMNLVPNIALEKEGGPVVIDHFSGEYNRKELDAFFSKMQEITRNEKSDSPIVLALNANKHAITIGYDPVKNEWKNIDANYPASINKRYSSSLAVKWEKTEGDENHRISQRP